MARSTTTRRKTTNTLAAWAVGLLIFFPILWTMGNLPPPTPRGVGG